MEKIAAFCQHNFDRHVEDLKALSRIPSVSFEGFPPAEVRRCAEATSSLLQRRGLENVKILELPGAHPYVYGDWLKAPGKPTVLLYAHYDVQPPGREELWQSPAFEPTLRTGPGGERLYGRGTADDKGGVIVHTAAISSYLESMGSLPVNVRVIIEGEEESGSSHLTQFLKTYRDLVQADVLVLTDAGNFDIGVPALTIALRGIAVLGIEVRALTGSVHSGMWGGPLPDPAMALAKMLSTLTDKDGRIAINGIRNQVRPLSPEEEAEFKKLPYTEAEFRKQSRLIPSAKILQEGPSPLAQTWRFPSLTINAMQASSRKLAANIINDTAWARISVRLVPDMNPDLVLQQLVEHLRAATPWGLEVKFDIEAGCEPWSQEPKGVAFEVAEEALKKGYGFAPYKVGCGGSIPFVGPFAEALGGAPALLIGVEDPHSAAHGENESILLADLLKACQSEIYLFSGLAERWKK